jgi:SAM-dependent methyltransferase
MPSDLEFTGERFVPGIAGEIAHEHWHRYVFARRYVAGKRVLDVACGEGYGSALLARVAANVLGVDIDADVVAHAGASYAALANVRFAQGSAGALPLPDASVDAVVSFETIEHLPREEQPRMLAEIARVLVPDGVLILSAPNPVEYSDARQYRNPFHMHEPDRAELETLLGDVFPAWRWFRQRRYFGSAVWSEAPDESLGDALSFRTLEAWTGDAAHAEAALPPPAMYFIVIAARAPAALPAAGAALSLYADRGDVELARIDGHAREVMRQDQLLRARDAALDRQTAHVKHLEELVAYRERIVEERDAQLAKVRAANEDLADERDGLAAALSTARHTVAAHATECDRLERALAAQERIIAYRQTMHWWFALPWLRVRLWWQRLRGA